MPENPPTTLLGLAATVPATCHQQRDLHAVFEASAASRRLRPRSRDLMRKLLTLPNGIETRHIAIEDLDHIFELDAETLNRAFETHAPRLAREAVSIALDRAGLLPRELDALFICTCTGYLCPGLSSYVAERVGLRADAYLHDLVGMGCGAAVPAWRAAQAFAQMYSGSRVAVVAVEICSAAFYLDDDPGVLISACLFGDGAACALLGPPEPHLPIHWQADQFDTLHRPADRELLRFANRGGKLRNQLHRSVPSRAAMAVSALHERFLGRLPSSDAFILAHPGGRDVVQALHEALPGNPALAESLWVLRHGGNLSSPSLLFALASVLRQTPLGDRISLPAAWEVDCPVPPQDLREIWLTSFGAGFSAHGFRLQAAPDLASQNGSA